jgi:hypothetical protein
MRTIHLPSGGSPNYCQLALHAQNNKEMTAKEKAGSASALLFRFDVFVFVWFEVFRFCRLQCL